MVGKLEVICPNRGKFRILPGIRHPRFVSKGNDQALRAHLGLAQFPCYARRESPYFPFPDKPAGTQASFRLRDRIRDSLGPSEASR